MSFAAIAASSSASAWENHALGTLAALRPVAEISQAASVQVESIEAFLTSEQSALVSLLDSEEAWAQKFVSHYPKRPSALRFRDGGSDLRRRFIQALRINPESKLALFAQQIPGHEIKTDARPAPLGFSAVSPLPGPSGYTRYPFNALSEGDLISPLDVVATASDEPDFGLDVGLWSDNNTAAGKAYGFGKQPYGNPAVIFSGQAPFHMGFFHEPLAAYAAASYLKRTFPEYRIHLYQSLARYAFATHHPYWGWRFAGWSVHYVQDLTQPYHSTALPGVSTSRMVEVGLLDKLGAHGPKNNSLQLVTNRHFALENFEFFSLREGLAQHSSSNPLLSALAEVSGDIANPAFTDKSPREVVAMRSHAAAAHADEALVSALPALLVNDPSYLFGEADPEINVLELLRTQRDDSGLDAMTRLLTPFMREFGLETRSLLNSIDRAID